LDNEGVNGESESNHSPKDAEKISKLTTEEKMEDIPKAESTWIHEVNVFYGNTSFYLFCRLLEVLYERLQKARELSNNPQTNSNFAFLMNPTKNLKDDDGDRYKSFKKILNGFISGAKDQNQYEDDCRTLFGIQAYILFTLDRVVSQLTKQLQALLSEEKSSKLLAMFTLNCNKPDERLYHSNCVKLLEDDLCFRFELERNPNRGLFTIQLLDSLHNPPMYIDLGTTEKIEKWSQYVDTFIASEDSVLDNNATHGVFFAKELEEK